MNDVRGAFAGHHEGVEGPVERFLQEGGRVVDVVFVLPSSPALASTGGEEEAPDEGSTQAMVITGYDEAVAEANGFEIITHPDGTQESVPRTPEAEAIRAQFKTVSPRGVVYGDCGSAYVWATRTRTISCRSIQGMTSSDLLSHVVGACSPSPCSRRSR